MNIQTNIRNEVDKWVETLDVAQEALLDDDKHTLAISLLDRYYYARRVAEAYTKAINICPDATDDDRKVMSIMSQAQDQVKKDIVSILEKSIIIEDGKYRVPNLIISL